MDASGELVNQVIDATHGAYHFEHAGSQHGHDDEFAHAVDARSERPHPSEKVVTTVDDSYHGGEQEA